MDSITSDGAFACGSLARDPNDVNYESVLGKDVDVYEEEDDDDDDESDADYRARMMHVDTFLRLNDSISSLRRIGEENPEYASEMQKIIEHASADGVGGGVGPDDRCADVVEESGPTATRDTEAIKVKTHAHLIYHGDLLQLSKETITLSFPKRDWSLFARTIDCFKRMLLGRYTDQDVARMRRDYYRLIDMWDDDSAASAGGSETTNSIGVDMKNLMRSMLNTSSLYYTNSLMAFIACGRMLRHLYAETEGGLPETYEQLIAFVRGRLRHNPDDPFACDCGSGVVVVPPPTPPPRTAGIACGDATGSGTRCSDEYKTLMSMIMEIPSMVLNQTYLLQILAYMMYDKSGREEVFINNLKNVCSPGLLDKVPTRLAMLMGTLDRSEIKRVYKAVRKQLHGVNPLRDIAVYNRNALEKIVQLVHNPRARALIEALPGAASAVVELTLPKCVGDKAVKCLNRDEDESDIMTRGRNNGGKNKCCGYLRQDPFDTLLSSVSLAQLMVYSLTDPNNAPPKCRKHYFVREIISAMAKQTARIKVDTLEDVFCYLDRTRVFRGFNEHPFMVSALQELMTSYIDYMKEAAEKYKETGKKRRVKRYLKKNGLDPSGIV